MDAPADSTTPPLHHSAEPPAPAPAPFGTAVVFVAGFTQRRDSAGEANGIHAAFDRVYRRFAGPQTLVEYYPWLVDPAEIAGSLHRRAAETLDAGYRMRMLLVGYSFGGGTVAEICRHLAATADFVDVAMLCDPVARWCGRLGWSRAMWRSALRLTNNVKKAVWYRQHNPRWRWTPPFFFPSSHEVRVRIPTQLYPHDIEAEHVDADNDTLFQLSVDWHVQRLVDAARLAASMHSPLTTHHSPTREAA